MSIDKTTILSQYPTQVAGANKIINGDMRIDQRNSGASVTPTTNQYTVDRWSIFTNVSSKVSVQQNAGSITPPAGFSNYLGLTSLSSYSSASGDVCVLGQRIESLNFADLNWGTANAKAVMLSFLIYSSMTGTFSGSISNSGSSRSYPFTYSVASANTWTTVWVPIPGDTSGSWSSSPYLNIYFDQGCGSTFRSTAGSWTSASYFGVTGSNSQIGTNGATWYITGVKLEVGQVATPFVPDDYQVSLQKCYRYCFVWRSTGNYDPVGLALQYSGASYAYLSYPVPMRVTPTFATTGGFGFGQNLADGSQNQSAAITVVGTGYGYSERVNGTMLSCASSGVTAGSRGFIMAYNSVGATLQFTAEL